MNMVSHPDAYANSVLVGRLSDTGHVTVLDLDGTNDGSPESRAEVDDVARQRGAIVYASARTEELMMSDREYALSVERYGFSRPRSHKPVHTHYQSQIDPDAMCPFGNVPQLLQKGGGYASDQDYLDLSGMKDWYWSTRRALVELDGDLKISNALASIEDERNYASGVADVIPLKFRIQLDFLGRTAFDDMMDIRKRITSSMVLFGMPRNVLLVDESNPAKERFTLYLVPRYAPKGRSVDRMIRKAVGFQSMPLSEITFDAAGDTFTDMSMLSALPGVKGSRFLLSGGSRLASHYTMGHDLFGTPFASVRTRAICRRLTATRIPGVYDFSMPGQPPRTFVNGDIRYPGLVGSESVRAFMEDTLD